MNKNRKYIYALTERLRGKGGRQGGVQIEIRRRVSRVLAGSRNTVPPVDLLSVAKFLGVGVRVVPLSIRGRLVIENRKVVVEINEDLLENDRRVTLAHELCHIILEKDRIERSIAIGEAVRSKSSKYYNEMEKYCDSASEEMILPTEWLMGNIESSPSAEDAKRIAGIAHVGLELCIKRAIDVGAWSCRYFILKVNGRSVSIASGYPGIDERSLEQVRLKKTTSQAIIMAIESGKGLPDIIEMDLDENSYKYYCESILLDPTTLLTLIGN